MAKHYPVCLLLLAMLLCESARAQQDVQFSQYVFNMLNVNTAYAGYRGGTSFNAIYRRQWEGIPGSPKTAGASIDWLTPAAEDRMALSANFLHEELGPQKTLSVGAGYTYRIPLDASGARRLCFGIGGGFTQYRLDGTLLTYVDEHDNSIPVTNASHIEPDANFGVYYYTPKWYATASIRNLLQTTGVKGFNWNDEYFRTLERNPHLYLGAGTVISLAENFKLKPSFLWKDDFKGPSNVDLSCFLNIHELVWIGGSYRTGIRIWEASGKNMDLTNRDAASAMVEFMAAKWLRVGYAYDFTTSGLRNYQSGSHEISISLFMPKRGIREVSPRYF
ncbi:PorP/SprF family type IX secretion system membrane protein [Chitinophaga sp. NPDC101104]|uniref:PorP/SprF family type IX secretion system membrane protein n=1 Tax=Chitinophaga sp. NPDC101104 TaxID=3390561 RepID=UPI003CFC1DB1